MNWIQVKSEIAPQRIEALEEGLLASGAVSVTMQDGADQPILEPELGTMPVWDDTTLTALFEQDTDMEQALSIAKEVFHHYLPDTDFPSLQVDILENEDWTRKWIENFKPISCGKRLWICPSWCEPPEPDAVNLMLDPGLAFGTGTHPTTFLCLEWLDAQDLKGKTVIDYGCGSGILGIAALLLGASRVIAVDNDPQALIATKDNAERNQLSADAIECYLPDDCPDIHADVLVANILAQPLYSLREHLSGLCKANASIALSGILREQAEDLSQHYGTHFKMQAVNYMDDWSRLSGTKKD
ncbi:MAG: 50S ribosomal protein L11 methyltransferase [Oleiphilaceae bacterium]|nr:50S ribosomal protein L11 methyltransferase [Oleiphilaceae bacterium]